MQSGDAGDVRLELVQLRPVDDADAGNPVGPRALGDGVEPVLLLGVEGGPPFTGDTSLYEFFGYFGLFCSTVLVLRVLVAIIRDGLN